MEWTVLRVLLAEGAARLLTPEEAAALRFRPVGARYAVTFARQNGPNALPREHAPRFEVWANWPAIIACDERRERGAA